MFKLLSTYQYWPIFTVYRIAWMSAVARSRHWKLQRHRRFRPVFRCLGWDTAAAGWSSGWFVLLNNMVVKLLLIIVNHPKKDGKNKFKTTNHYSNKYHFFLDTVASAAGEMQRRINLKWRLGLNWRFQVVNNHCLPMVDTSWSAKKRSGHISARRGTLLFPRPDAAVGGGKTISPISTSLGACISIALCWYPYNVYIYIYYTLYIYIHN